jgi:hypothetical protein
MVGKKNGCRLFAGMKNPLSLPLEIHGALAQLARVLDWQSRGHRFDSDMLHEDNQPLTPIGVGGFFLR